jgi:hypothetical protein
MHYFGLLPLAVQLPRYDPGVVSGRRSLSRRDSDLVLDLLDCFLDEERQAGSRRHDVSTRSIRVERDDVSEVERDVIAVDIGQIDPHGRISLLGNEYFSGKQDSPAEATTYQRFLPSSVSTGSEPVSKLSKRRMFTLIRGRSKSGW